MSDNLKVPKDWEIAYLGSLVKIGTGSKDTQDKVEGGKYPFYVRSQTIERINTYSFDGVAILTVGDGVGTGKVFHFTNGKIEIHQRVYKLSDFTEKVVPNFLYHYFSENFINRVDKLSAKASVDSVRMEMISKMPIPLPPISEQEKISDVLSCVDKVIELTELEVEKLVSIKKGMMQELLTKGIGHAEFKKDRIGSIPKKWKVESLGNITTKVIDGPHVTPQYVAKGVPFVTIKNITSGYLSFDDLKYISMEDHLVFCKRGKAENGDILYTKDGTIGFTCVVDTEREFSYFVSVALIKLKKNLVNPRFMNYVFQSDSIFNQTSLLTEGSGLKHMVLGKIKSLLVPLPPIKEQEEIVDVLSGLDKLLNSKRVKVKDLKNLKKGLSHELLTGKVRVKV